MNPGGRTTITAPVTPIVETEVRRSSMMDETTRVVETPEKEIERVRTLPPLPVTLSENPPPVMDVREGVSTYSLCYSGDLSSPP